MNVTPNREQYGLVAGSYGLRVQLWNWGKRWKCQEKQLSVCPERLCWRFQRELVEMFWFGSLLLDKAQPSGAVAQRGGGTALGASWFSISVISVWWWWTKLCSVTCGLVWPNVLKLERQRDFKGSVSAGTSSKKPGIQKLRFSKGCFFILDHIWSIHCCKSKAVWRTRLCSQLLLICLCV